MHSVRSQQMHCFVTTSRKLVEVRMDAQLFAAYLRFSPIALALFRSAELRPLAGVDLERPLLEVGCGGGLFARCALKDCVDVGLDISPRQVCRAGDRNCYDRLDAADARSMPYPDNSFRTVLAISVLEHIEGPQQALGEIYRVLEPGGTFVATIVLRDLNEFLTVPRLLARIGLSWIGRAYAGAFDAVFRHVSMRRQSEWEEMLAEAGFGVTERTTVVSRRTMRWFEMFLFTAWPYRLLSRWNSRPLRPTWCSRLVARWMRNIIHGTGDGCCLFVTARKPERAGVSAPCTSAIPAGSLNP